MNIENMMKDDIKYFLEKKFGISNSVDVLLFKTIEDLDYIKESFIDCGVLSPSNPILLYDRHYMENALKTNNIAFILKECILVEVSSDLGSLKESVFEFKASDYTNQDNPTEQEIKLEDMMELHTRDGYTLIVLQDNIVVVKENGLSFDMRVVYNQDLTHHASKDKDIIKITKYGKLIQELNQEVVEWESISIDERVLVSNDGKEWYNRHFAGVIEGHPYVFKDGRTSWTAREQVLRFKYIRLYKENN